MFKTTQVALVLVVALFTGCAAVGLKEPESPQTLGERLVRQLWADMKARDMEAMQEITASGFQSAHTDGMRNREEELRLVSGLSLGDCVLSDIRSTRHGPVIVTTYYVSVAETIEGERLSAKPAPRMSVFVKTDESWQWMAHANFKSLKR